MATESTPDAAAWLALRQSSPHPLARLVLVPGAGAGAGYFRGWFGALPDWVEVHAVAAPGREHRIEEEAPDRLLSHVDGVVEALGRLDALPLVFFGHSMGALVAWEAARALRRRGGRSARMLFVAGMLPPRAGRRGALLADLPDEELILELRHRFAGFPPELDRYPDLRQLMLRTVRRDLTALETWSPEPEQPLDVPIRMLAARDDVAAPPGSVFGWRRETRSSAKGMVFDGGHDFVSVSPEPILEFVAAELRRELIGGPAR